MKKPRICLIGRGYPHKKTPTYRFPLYLELIKRHNIDIILMEREQLSTKDKKKIPKHFTYLKFTPFPFYIEGMPFKLISHLKKKKYDIIISMETSSSISLMIAFLKPFLKFKLIIFSELWFYPRLLKAKLALPVLKWIVKRADGYIATWKEAKKKFIEFGAKKQIFIAPDSANDLSKTKFDEAKLEKIRKQYDSPNKKIILYIGRFVKYKGLDYLIKAFAKLEKEMPNATLLIIGQGEFGNECQSLAKKLKVKNLIFRDWVPFQDTVYYYHLSDVFVLPARFDYSSMCPAEAWGMTVHEAMSVKTPVIATNAVASAMASITSGEDGFLIKEKNINQLYSTLKKIVGNDNLINQMGSKAQQTVQNKFNISIMANGFTHAIEHHAKKKKKTKKRK